MIYLSDIIELFRNIPHNSIRIKGDMELDLKHEPAVVDVVDRCNGYTSEYNKINSTNPNRLVLIEQKLSTYFYYLITKKADYKAAYERCKASRKVSFSRKAIIHKKDNSQATSDHLAMAEIEDEMKEEILNEWRFNHLKGVCEGIDKINISISHALKNLNQERTWSK